MINVGRRSIVALLAAAVVSIYAGPPGADGATPAPAPTAPSCADEYPDPGPAGIDLRLGCMVGRVTGLDLGTGSGRDIPFTTYLTPVAGLLGGAIAVGLLVRFLRRRAAARLAPTLPTSWWACPRCGSVNRDGAARCYACGAPWTADAQRLPMSGPDRPAG